MGALCSQTSTKNLTLSNERINSPSEQESISLLGQRSSVSSIRPDSPTQWNSRLHSPLPRATPLFDRSNTPSNLHWPYRSIISRTDMSVVGDLKYKCDQCGMVFPSNENLFKHKTRFCIGVKDSGIGRKPVYSDDEESTDSRRNLPLHTSRSTRNRVTEHPSSNHQRYGHQSDWTSHFAQQRSTRKIENSDQHDQTYQEILLDYERIQAQERDLLREMYNLNPDTSGGTARASNVTDRLRTQLDELQRRNRLLEQERRIIQEKLEELITNNYQPSRSSNNDPNRFLGEMKRQKDLNDKAMDFLRQRLIFPSANDVARAEKTGADNARELRNDYLHAGGHDANTLAKYTDIEYQLRTYENYPWMKDYPEPLKPARYPPTSRAAPASSHDPTAEQIKLANEENFLLQVELEEMQQKYYQLDQRTKQLELSVATASRSHSRDPSMNRTERYDPPMTTNSYMNDQIPEQDHTHLPAPTNSTLAASLEKRVTPRASPAMTLLASNMNNIRDPLAPHPYDPKGGFVIFFDFILHLPSNVTLACLITCLHHPKSGLGEPSQLETFKCEPYVDERNGQRMSVAFIAMKQPVPRCPPQQALTVVLELQTTTKKENVTGDDLKTEAWAKLPLFDQKNRLLSGRWKVPLISLPIQQDESLAVISTLPQFDHSELYYRLVNGQDGEDQSNASISPNMRDLYFYPPQFRNRPVM